MNSLSFDPSGQHLAMTDDSGHFLVCDVTSDTYTLSTKLMEGLSGSSLFIIVTLTFRKRYKVDVAGALIL